MQRFTWQRLTSIARRQHGLITAAQAVEAGIPRSSLRSWVKAGRLKRWLWGVYALAGMPDGWERRAMAAVLAAGPHAVLCGRAAARVHGSGLPACRVNHVVATRARPYERLK